MKPTSLKSVRSRRVNRTLEAGRVSDSSCDSKPRAAFSLLETIVATVLVTITLVTSLNSLAYVLKATSHSAHANQATAIAQVLLSEITAQPFEDMVNATGSIGREIDETLATRIQWDDCDDYHGWNVSSITDRQGNVMAAASGWTVNVTVNYATISDPGVDSAVATKLKKIRLSLTAPSGQTFVSTSLRCDKGTLLEPQSLASSILSHVDIAVQAGGKSMAAGTRVHNQQELN